MSVTVDGFVGGPNGEIDWIYKSMGPDVMRWLADTLSQAGVHIMGSRTYQDMASYWPYSTDPLASPMNEIPKIVFSRRGSLSPSAESTTAAFKDATRINKLEGSSSAAILAEWAQPRIAGGQLEEEIAKLKQEAGKDILAHGGASFARSLSSKGLVDEYHLLIHPVVLGNGLSLFSGLPQPLSFKLIRSTKFETGTMANVYRPE
jgi:dihydrofolate reductase